MCQRPGPNQIHLPGLGDRGALTAAALTKRTALITGTADWSIITETDIVIRQEIGGSSPVSDALAEMGRFGQKTGRGFYIYENGSRVPMPDTEVAKLAAEKAEALGIKRRNIAEQEILERMIYPMINEAGRILEAGIAIRSSDIDVIWTYGYGWPVWRGGPCFYADLIGAKAICDALDHYAELTGDASLKPTASLREMAATAGKFADFGRQQKAAA